MSKGKREKFSELRQMPHVFQNFVWDEPSMENHLGEKVNYKGQWNEVFFNNNNPIVLELACGYGEYTMAMAERFPEKNFIGIDLKGNRIYTGAKYAMDKGLKNVAFIRMRIESLCHFFAEAEISEIWIPFPDPQLKKSKARKRLTNYRFLNLYRKVLQPGGFMHLKTDNTPLYEYSLESLQENGCEILEHYRDIHGDRVDNALLQEVKTRYEKMHLEKGETIKYIRFRFG